MDREDWQDEEQRQAAYEHMGEQVEEEQDTPCECDGKGWLVMNEGAVRMPYGEIQACDCGLLENGDEEAARWAQAAGYKLREDYRGRFVVVRRPGDEEDVDADFCACPDCDELACAGHGSDDPSAYTFCHACELAGCTERESACCDDDFDPED